MILISGKIWASKVTFLQIINVFFNFIQKLCSIKNHNIKHKICHCFFSILFIEVKHIKRRTNNISILNRALWSDEYRSLSLRYGRLREDQETLQIELPETEQNSRSFQYIRETGWREMKQRISSYTCVAVQHFFQRSKNLIYATTSAQ